MSAKPRKLFYQFHWPLLALLLLLLAIGMVNLYSATASSGGDVSPFFKTQMVWTLIGLVVMGLALTFHYRLFFDLAPWIYGVSLLLLLLVPFFGKAMGGQQNWLVIGGFRMQPSELAKLATALMLSRYFAKHPKQGGLGLRDILAPLAIVLAPMLLILSVKDLGAAIFFVLIGATYLFVAGVKWRWILLACLLGVLVAGVGYRFFLKPYQRDRIQTFLEPERDPRGRGYHLLQSKIAVGSGEFLGRGFLKGNLNKFKFLPERHTDFVFPVLAEEWGFAGSAVTLGVFGLLFLVLLQAAGKVQDRFGGFLILGVTALLFWQMAINLCGVLGLMPLAGVTLPFLSYGGSALLVTLLAFGLVFNVHMRRYMF